MDNGNLINFEQPWLNRNLFLHIIDYTMVPYNADICFGHGEVNGVRVSYFLATSPNGDAKLEEWNRCCYAGDPAGVTSKYSMVTYGFTQVYWRGISGTLTLVRVLVTGNVTKTITNFIEELSNDVNTIEGIQYIALVNQYSIALYNAKDRYLTCTANELLVGENNQFIVPLRCIVPHPLADDWFERDVAENDPVSYIVSVEGMFLLYAQWNLFGTPNINLQILREQLW